MTIFPELTSLYLNKLGLLKVIKCIWSPTFIKSAIFPKNKHS
ncbi:unnamed protein product [Schistosoma curassoni]|uniref:Uncharacterized protein n=1 Tax=Schistosoma curassoni TaxID=6186 RepID=A0A183KF78_9TREM|nr:unnamed protein product [Schistosoma curassoni]